MVRGIGLPSIRRRWLWWRFTGSVDVDEYLPGFSRPAQFGDLQCVGSGVARADVPAAVPGDSLTVKVHGLHAVHIPAQGRAVAGMDIRSIGPEVDVC